MSAADLAQICALLGIRPEQAEALVLLLGAASGADRRILPDVLYTAKEANRLLGFGERMTIYEIDEKELTTCRVGAGRGSNRYLGADLLAYARGLDLPDIQALADGARDRLEARLSRPSAVVGAVGTTGRRRIV